MKQNPGLWHSGLPMSHMIGPYDRSFAIIFPPVKVDSFLVEMASSEDLNLTTFLD